MLRLILFLVAVAALAAGLAWLADRPGNLLITWEGYEIETSVFRAVVLTAFLIGLLAFIWSLVRQLIGSPAAMGRFFDKRRQKRGLEALSTGMIAIGAGDRENATRYAIQARKSLPNEPLTHLLRAQAAQLSGDKVTARRIFEAMLGSPDTEQLGLRGLFLEAERVEDRQAARSFADRAVRINPKLGWGVDALFDLQCREGDWTGALDTLAIARRNYHIDKATADRRRAVLLTAKAQAAEETDPETALTLALEAHGLASDLIPAAAIAGRMLAARGNTPRAAKIIQKTWMRSPHPDLATAYAYARIGDSPRDRYERVKKLSFINPMSSESSIALAHAAIEARMFPEARAALEPLLDGRLTQRVATMMARIEGEQHADKGRVREWLARAVNAPRDPAWTADGVVSEHWGAVSPVTGALDAFQWRVPVSQLEPSEGDLLARKLEELVALGAPPATEIEAEGKAEEIKTVGEAAKAGDERPAAKPKNGNTRAPVDEAIVIEDKPAPAAKPKTVITEAEPQAAKPPAPAPVATPEPTTQPSKTAKSDTAATTAPATKRPPAGDTVPPEKVAPAPEKAAEAAPVSATAARTEAEKPEATTRTSSTRRAAPAASKPAQPAPRTAPASKPAEPRIFVSPPAPDDPGTGSDGLDDGGPLRPHRA